VIWSACYMLWMYQRVFYGKITNLANARLADANPRERMALWPLVVMALLMGIASPLWIRQMEPSIADALPKVAAPQPAASRTLTTSDTREVRGR